MRGDLFAYELPLRRSPRSENSELRSRCGLLLRLSTGGLSGWGEAAPLPERGTETLRDAHEALAGWLKRERFEGSAQAVLERTAQEMSQTPSAQAAAGFALSDICAQMLGVTLGTFLRAHCLSGLSRRTASISTARLPRAVRSAVLLSGNDPSEIAIQAEEAQSSGGETFKLKVGFRTFESDLARVAALRATTGPQANIRLDANGAWRPGEAAANLKKLAEFNPEFLEEPCCGLEEIQRLQANCPFPLAADESLPVGSSFTDLIAREQHPHTRLSGGTGLLGVDVAVLKPSLFGSPAALLPAALALHVQGTKIVVSSALESAVGLTALAHFAAALGNKTAAGLGTAHLFANNLCEQPQWTSGSLLLPSGAGLGVQPEIERLQPV